MPMTRPFHLGWFANFTADEWTGVFANGGLPWDGKFYVEMAQALERAGFDFLMLEDKLAVSESYGGSMEVYLKYAVGMAPKHDPVPLAAMIFGATSQIGVVATMSTLGYPPFLLARLCSTVDSLSGGRFGWNIVTSAEDLAAQNFGLEKLPPRELRYDMAEEYTQLVYRLFDSWEPDAVLRDRESGVYADYRKVHAVNFEGKYFRSRGPLNTVRSPQGRPTLLQAGGSPKGRAFAARHADCVISLAEGVAGMKAYRDDIRARAAAEGRDPDKVKVMFLVAPQLGETEQEARDKYARGTSGPAFIEQSLALISAITDIDFSKFELDAPLPGHLTTNGEQGTLEKFQQWGSGKTLRELVVESSGGTAACIELVGTPAQVAEMMGDAMAEIGGDGFLITTPGQGVSRRQVIEVTDGLVPELQRRGLVRMGYTQKLLRDNLTAF
jgi:FMN-dependent oxidoreductase (nitrilotriacetate monooxygenase family)